MKSEKKSLHQIDVEGSLGVLAYGDIAFRKWREIKRLAGQTIIDEEE